MRLCNASSKQIFANFLVIFLLILPEPVLGYTEEDLHTKCEPCDPGGPFVIHPTDCSGYFYCSGTTQWVFQICPAATYFVEDEQVCVNPLEKGGVQCDYDLGINENVNKDVREIPQCSASTTTTGQSTGSNKSSTDEGRGNTGQTTGSNKSSTDGEHGTTDSLAVSTTGGTGEEVNLTVVLAVLLGVTFALLIFVVLGIMLYKRRQNQRRPKYFYTRESPSNGATARIEAPPAAGNAAYLSRSLLTSARENRDKRVESVDYEMPMSDEPYSEIPERSSKAYYSDPADRPPMPLPVITIPTTPDYTDDIYAVTTTPELEKPDGYMHPVPVNPAEDSHVYRAKDDSAYDGLDVEDPYDYCQPEIANPTLSFRKGTEPPPATSPQSPPYYVDPIPDAPPGPRNPYPYHTLEPLVKKE